MQYVNDDMDDLFRKAGEQYPLQPGIPDWDKVAAALAAENTAATMQRTGKRHLLWLLLLLPLAWVCNHYWLTGNDKDVVTPSVGGVLPVPPQPGGERVTAQIRGGSREKPPIVKQKGAQPLPTQQHLQEWNRNISVSPSANSETAAVGLPDRHTTSQAQDASPGATSTQLLDSAPASPTLSSPEGHAGQAVARLMADVPSFTGLQLQPSVVYDAARQALAEDSTGQHPPVGPGKPLRERNWYAGVMGSADLTSVQLQRTSRVGWQTGLLAGYQFSRRWSVETGFYLSRKYYYTEGEYFDKGQTYIPPNTTITEVNGYCTMIELPLNIRYNLVQSRQHSWFATAGLSSYFMKREGYDFLYYYQNSGTSRIHSKTYNNASRNLFSVAQLTGGYTRSLGPNFSVRVEPYFKLPLTGLGYGKLHFSSTGLNLGVVKRF